MKLLDDILEIAKAMTLALIQIAAEEKRALYLISFSVDYEVLCVTDPSATGELERIVCFLSNSFYGGTDIGPAFDRACEALDEEDFVNADVLMVSDFLTPPLSSRAKRKSTSPSRTERCSMR